MNNKPSADDERRNKPWSPAPHILERLDMLCFFSQGRMIRMERFVPITQGPHPTVFVLPGGDYMEFFSAACRSMARQLTANGYLVFLVYYFDFTRTRYDREASTFQQDKTYFEHFHAWMHVICDAIKFAADQPNVDSDRIGLFGISLSASLALAVASVAPEVRAVVEYYGKMPECAMPRVNSLPPTLILHGNADLSVPVTEAYRLQYLMQAFGTVYDIHIYSGQGHGFRGAARADSLQRTIAFYDRYLKEATFK